jgi:hypothetical protein
VCQPERELELRFQIDTNRINARGRREHMNRLAAWAENELMKAVWGRYQFRSTETLNRRRVRYLV